MERPSHGPNSHHASPFPSLELVSVPRVGLDIYTRAVLVGRRAKHTEKKKPSEDALLETIFGDAPRAVSEDVAWGKFLESLRDLLRDME